ncbi:hypothetical protein [Streptomyces luteolus]|uniref:Uncharacterized protein n=1 Tax=Streptomyces luteolus TaxID=3043615 RepID=A0ABT6SRL8_9ACTN|nr:hypothetical protein [Streptomyces sp. B-S-A12]MDI3418010.1 hypothetical protein [Streptomyces sp. B-S-A12]
MSTKSPDSKKNQTIDFAHFGQFAENTAEQLGSGWTVDPDSVTSPVAFLTHPDGRRVGLRHLWRGQAVQTWAADVPPREYANENDAKVMAANSVHLTEGSRYNAGVTFTHTSPAAATAKKIRTRLLPAYDSKRPSLRSFPSKRSRTNTTPQSGSATTSTSESRKQRSPRKRRTAAPATGGAKTTAAPRSRRTQKEPENTTTATAQVRGGNTAIKAPSKRPRTTEPEIACTP